MTKTNQITNSTALMTAMYRFVSDANAGMISTQFMEGGVLKTYSFPNAKKIQAPVPNLFNQAYEVTNADFLEKIEQMPNGGYLFLRLQEDVVWDRRIIKKNVNIHINLDGFKLTITEYIDANNQSNVQRLHSVGSTLSFDGNNKLSSKIILPQKSQNTAMRSDYASFLFGGWMDSSNNSLHISRGVTVVDNGDFYLISSKAGGSMSVVSASLNSTTGREWKDLIQGIQIVNGVAKNFSTNITL